MSMSILHLQEVKDIAETRERDKRCSGAREMPGQGTFRKHDVRRFGRAYVRKAVADENLPVRSERREVPHLAVCTTSALRVRVRKHRHRLIAIEEQLVRINRHVSK